MRLTLPELCALELGLAMLRAERPPDETRAIDGARERLRQVIAKLPGQDIQEKDFAASLGGAVDLEMLSLLRRAVREHRRVRFSYHKSGADAAATRVAAPLAVVYAELSWYLVALADGAAGLRFFRLDRMDEVEVTEEAFEVPAEFSVDAVLRERKMFMAEGVGTLKVRYSARVARWVAEREGVLLEADGTVTLEHPLADPHWALRHVLQYGPDAEVLEPKAIREAIAGGACGDPQPSAARGTSERGTTRHPREGGGPGLAHAKARSREQTTTVSHEEHEGTKVMIVLFRVFVASCEPLSRLRGFA